MVPPVKVGRSVGDDSSVVVVACEVWPNDSLELFVLEVWSVVVIALPPEDWGCRVIVRWLATP